MWPSLPTSGVYRQASLDGLLVDGELFDIY